MHPALPLLRSSARFGGRRRRRIGFIDGRSSPASSLASKCECLGPRLTRSAHNHAPSKSRSSSTIIRSASRPTTTSASQSAPSSWLQLLAGRGRNVPLSLSISKSQRALLGNTAYVALASGFLMTDMLALRVALVGGYTGLVAFHSLHARPLKIPLGWSAVFVLVNASAAALLVADQFGSLNEEEGRLYDEHFSVMTRGQFRQLLDLGHARIIPSGSRLTTEGMQSDTLYFTKRGHSKLYFRGRYAKDIEEGSFVNDVAFQQGEGEGAYGTVVADGEVEVIEWNFQELRQHLQSRPDMDTKMQLCLTSHLVKGLLQQRKAAVLALKDEENGVTLDTFRRDLPEGMAD
ncbi:hypothetical protein ACHAXT_003434 [Thalassiosira profunda]